MVDAPAVTVLCGGVGAARFLRGLVEVLPPSAITAVVNVADDMVLHGLHISPDIDTVIYTLADAIDPERGWGLRDESWAAMEAMSRYGDGDWFSLGDRDLATHMQRTGRLDQGTTLTDVTEELRTAWGVDIAVIPASDDPVSTRVTLADTGEEIAFQQYFVGRQHAVPISSVRFAGIDDATTTVATRNAIADADLVVLAPSNPIVSIAPILDLGDTRTLFAQRHAPTIAISPIVGGTAIKGPAANMLRELGHDVSSVGVAALYRDVAELLVIDDTDASLAKAVAATGCVPVVTDTIMRNVDRAAALATRTLSVAGFGSWANRD